MIQQFWDRCSLCPVCHNRRVLRASVGPDRFFRDTSFQKEDNVFRIKTYYKWKDLRYCIHFDIDCLTNTFTASFEDQSDQSMDAAMSLEDEKLFKRVDYARPYFWIDGNCHHCERTAIHTTDIILDMRTMQLIHNDIGIERELIYVMNQYEIILRPLQKEMDIGKLIDGGIKMSQYLTCPLVDIDFSNPEQALKRVETLLVFG